MNKTRQFDFGFESRTTDYKSAKIVLMFVASGTEADFGKAKGPLAVADASRYAEFFEMDGNLSPFEIGVCSEILGKNDAEARIVEARQSKKIPIVVADFTSLVDLSVNIDVLQKGLTWYKFIDALESDFSGPGAASAELIGVGAVEPRSPRALLCAQILIKMVGFMCKVRR